MSQRDADKIKNSQTYAKKGLRPFLKVASRGTVQYPGLQNIHTPFTLCNEIVGKLSEYCSLSGKTICVLFNLEFVEVLVKDFGVLPSQITFIADSVLKARVAKAWYNVGEVHQVAYVLKEIDIMPKIKKQFDVVVMNPPYQAAKEKSDSLWKTFIVRALDLVKDEGFLVSVNPCSWRKPEHKLFDIFQNNHVRHLEIHNQKDGMNVFGAGTRYDWYVMQKGCQGESVVLDEQGQTSHLDLRQLPCLPHCDIDFFQSLLSDTNKCDVVYSRSGYGHDKPHMSKDKTEQNRFQCVNATKADGLSLMYSNTKKNGHFGVPKVIMGIVSPQNGFFDKNGEFGITDNCFGLKVLSKSEGENITKAIKTEKFASFVNSCKWAGMAFDPTVFQYFRKDFWKEFI